MIGLHNPAVSTALRWLGRALAVALFLFWGAFFVEHVAEWFVPHARELPGWVWVAQALHLGMLVGLALTIWKQRTGVVMTLLATVAFFATIGAAWPLALLNLAPALAFAAAWVNGRGRPRGGPASV
jgi:hypothetical protein